MVVISGLISTQAAIAADAENKVFNQDTTFDEITGLGGVITIVSGVTVQFNQSVDGDDVIINNYGTIIFNNPESERVINYEISGTINNHGDIYITSADSLSHFVLDGTLNNYGNFDIITGGFAGHFLHNYGTFSGGAMFENGAYNYCSGIITGSVNNVVNMCPDKDVTYWKMANGEKTEEPKIAGPIIIKDQLKGVGDVDGDGTDDIVWQEDNGQVYYWPILNGHRTENSEDGIKISTPIGKDWHFKGVGDVDGDGTDNIVWQHDSGVVDYWPMLNGVRYGSQRISGPVGSVWQIKGVGDVNGDGTDDIIWRHSNGQVIYWPMINGVIGAGIDISVPITSDWHIKGVGDVDGDDTDDIVWQHDSGVIDYWPMINGVRHGSVNISGAMNTQENQIKGIGDVNGDGTDDIIWVKPNK